ncbi:proton-conducting transporter transmembrane domain-containing protein [Halobellus limi]|uniref:Oxidoreductase n=1 Tax=Halobellus limi TaxID=699433 RepID=A0A1H6AUL9_9EURY|nr:proton-conducting transporter membrane subunit [Halobellus limi]QCC47754.1 oxidoreductase [Halobellus limi]SEG51950.1 NAD(P)H-quinone oxidoreductase subunit 5 [Halobellus limi]
MTGENQSTTVGELPNASPERTTLVPVAFTRLVWALCVASLGALAARLLGWWSATGTLGDVVAVDGLTLLLWVVVTFFSGIVHSYSRRYMAGDDGVARFFTRVFAFTLVVMVLVAANHAALFAVAWLAMGLVMADLIGHVRGWPQAQAAAALARRYFLASSGLLSLAVAVLWWQTGATTVAGIAASVGSLPASTVLLVSALLVLAAMIQSALLPFHAWLLASMTAPTPASALMHAGFVNAGGILLVRFAPVVTANPEVMLGIVVVGAVSALGGKLLKSVQPDVKRRLGCSTVGQMGFMIMQAGLGFFGAAITHLVLHGFYKAYKFLSSGSRVERTSPTAESNGDSLGAVGTVATILSAVAGGAVFVWLTGKGAGLDSGLLLALVVVLTTLHATRETISQTALPVVARAAVVPLVFLPAIAVYGMVYRAVEAVLAGLPVVAAPAPLTAGHGLVAAAFVLAYLAIETGVYRRSRRLYVTLLNASRPPSATVLNSTEDYNEY